MYSFVIVDTPHVLDHRTSTAIAVSDYVILVTVANISSIRATRKSLDFLRSEGYSQEKVRILVNRVNKKDGISLSDIRSTLDYPVTWTVPNDYRDVIESINTGIPLMSRKRLSSVGKSIRQLGADIQSWVQKTPANV
jgi:pilus assembly protein CpaE